MSHQRPAEDETGRPWLEGCGSAVGEARGERLRAVGVPPYRETVARSIVALLLSVLPLPSFAAINFSAPVSEVFLVAGGGPQIFGVEFTIEESPPLDFVITHGFTMAVRHDPAVVQVTFVDPAGPLLDLTGGAPEFFGVVIYPDGWSAEVVYGAGQVIDFVPAQPAVNVLYAVDPDALPPGGPTSVTLTWDDTLGAPGLVNEAVVSAAGATVAAGLADGAVTLSVMSGTPFVRGECNGSTPVDIGDAILLLEHLFGSGISPVCPAACDVNDDGGLDVGDAVFLLGFLFSSGPPPSAPFPDCGADPTPDSLGCASSPSC